MGALDLVAKMTQSGKKAAPFFSKADIVLDELQRGKGTGNEFLTELVKKGAKPTELKERGIEAALKDKPKMSKSDVQKVFQEKSAPRIKERVYGGKDYEEALDQKAAEYIGDPYATFDDLHGRDRDLAKAEVDGDFGYKPEPKYEDYKTPGGQNYREILLKLPAQRSEREIADQKLVSFIDKVSKRLGRVGWDFESMTPDELVEYEALNKLVLSASKTPPAPYASPHWKGEPNVLAHIRVQDFKTPEGKKVLLVDEIQSDWHQEGRKKGYKGEFANKTEQEFKTYAKELASKYDLNPNQNLAMYATMKRMQPEEVAKYEQLQSDWVNSNRGVPDAPFKKNWHELAMKRVLDYAAENGYDTVAITPGAEQAKRYDLSKQVDELLYKKNPDGTYQLSAQAGGRGNMLGESIPAEKLEDYVGKDVAQKIIDNRGTERNLGGSGSVSQPQDIWGSLSGEGLQVGGEGMKGFYDKILPDYLNTYGKQYGAGVGKISLKTPSVEPWNIEDAARFHGMTGPEYLENPNRFLLEKQFLENRGNKASEFHAFDITPQMREAIKTKGQPLYSAMGAEGLAGASGAATIGSEALMGNDEQPVQNPVHFTENPDAMRLELMQRN